MNDSELRNMARATLEIVKRKADEIYSKPVPLVSSEDEKSVISGFREVLQPLSLIQALTPDDHRMKADCHFRITRLTHQDDERNAELLLSIKELEAITGELRTTDDAFKLGERYNTLGNYYRTFNINQAAQYYNKARASLLPTGVNNRLLSVCKNIATLYANPIYRTNDPEARDDNFENKFGISINKR